MPQVTREVVNAVVADVVRSLRRGSPKPSRL